METPKTHWKKLTDPRFIGAHDLDKDFTVTIESIKKEMVKGMDGKEEMLVVARFEKAKKPMILNKTNMKIIAKNLESNFIEDWTGKSITLYAAKVKAFGEFVDAIRVKAK